MARLLHTRIRVGDLEASIRWYTENLGFELARRTERSPAGNQLAFLVLPGNEHSLELAYSPDYKPAVPEDLMHLAIGVPDLAAFCAELAAKQVEIWPDDWRAKLAAGRKMAFVTDPDGYEVELLERQE